MKHVIVVGAGPTGATLALLLARAGIGVKLIEASQDFQRKFRGEGLMPSGLDVLEQIGLNSTLEKVPHRAIDSWEVVINRRSLFKVAEPFQTNGKPCTLVSQPHLLAEIITEAQKYDCLEFYQGEPVKTLLKNESGRLIGVKLASGQEYFSDLVVAADGRSSQLRKQAGIELKKLSSAIDILWFKLSPGELLSSENIFYSIVQDRAAFGLFRSSTGDLNLGWGLYKDDDYDWKTINWRTKLADVAPGWLAEHLRDETTTITAPLFLSVMVGCCDRWSKPGILLLGDAAHPMSPIRAQGINMALQDALVASQQLIAVAQAEADADAVDKTLEQIQALREPTIRKIQKLQNQELAQAKKLRKYGILRLVVSQFAPVIGRGIRFSWLRRQLKMR